MRGVRLNPYEVLGVSPRSAPEEIEAAYHQRLRECHPDLHWANGPDAVAQAEKQTRAITAAMAQLRREWAEGPRDTAPPTGSASAGGAGTSWDAGTAWQQRTQHASWSNFGYNPDAEHDWFGNPLDRRIRADHVDCPLCGQRYDDPGLYRQHLSTAHGIGDPVFSTIPETPSPLAGKGRSLGWVPWPTFWFAVLLFLYWGTVVAAISNFALRVVFIWLGVFGYLVLLRLALKHRRAR